MNYLFKKEFSLNIFNYISIIKIIFINQKKLLYEKNKNTFMFQLYLSLTVVKITYVIFALTKYIKVFSILRINVKWTNSTTMLLLPIRLINFKRCESLKKSSLTFLQVKLYTDTPMGNTFKSLKDDA